MISRILNFELYPNFMQQKGVPASIDEKAINPVLKLDISGDGGNSNSKLVRFNGSTVLDDLQIYFADLRYWAQYEIIRDPGITYIYLGCLFIIVGLTLRIAFVHKKLSLSFSEESQGIRIVLSGWSEKYTSTFKNQLFEMSLELQSSNIVVNS